MIATSDYFHQSNDNTFNVVVHQQCFEHDKFIIVIKRGGMITASSISKPGYTIITNVIDDPDKPSVFEYDSFANAMDRCERLSNGRKLKPSTKYDIKSIITDVVGRYVVLSKHNRKRLLSQIEQCISALNLDALEPCINGSQTVVDQLHNMLSIIDTMTVSHANKQMYNIGIRLLDKMYHIVNKLNDCSDDQSVKQLVSSIMILTNYLPRYE